jgi:hypothetical protein
MHTLNHRCLGIAAAGAFVALIAVGLSARADDSSSTWGRLGLMSQF